MGPPRTQAQRGLLWRVAISLHNGAGCISVGTPQDMETQIKESLTALMEGIKRADGDAVALQTAGWRVT